VENLGKLQGDEYPRLFVISIHVRISKGWQPNIDFASGARAMPRYVYS